MDEDIPQPLSGNVDTIKPWTIKSVPTEIRDLAIMAARKEGLTVGQWLERRIRAWCQEQQEEDEGKSSSGGLTLPVSAPQVFPGRPPDHLLAVERMVNLAAEVAALSPDLQKDPIMRAARGTLKAVLTSLRPQAPMQANPPRLQADPGKPDAPE